MEQDVPTSELKFVPRQCDLAVAQALVSKSDKDDEVLKWLPVVEAEAQFGIDHVRVLDCLVSPPETHPHLLDFIGL